MILSTAWTTPAVVLKMKSETRRDWSQKQIELARKQMESQTPVDLWDKSPRFKGKPYGTCLIASLVDHEDASTIPDESWEREGFHVLSVIGASFMKGLQAPDVWRNWRHSEPGANIQTVVGLADITLNDYGRRLLIETHERYPEVLQWPLTLADMREQSRHLPEWSKV
jgi:hypothetical protein